MHQITDNAYESAIIVMYEEGRKTLLCAITGKLLVGVIGIPLALGIELLNGHFEIGESLTTAEAEVLLGGEGISEEEFLRMMCE